MENYGLAMYKNKEWKFVLSEWEELPDLHRLVGSTFIISQINMKRNADRTCTYELYLAPLPEHNPLSVIYKSVMDVTDSLNRNSKKSSRKKKPAKKKKSK